MPIQGNGSLVESERNKEKRKFDEREEKVRELLKQLADDSSLHGFKQIHENKGPRKYVWLIAFLLALTLVTLLFHNTVADYLNYKTYIETEYHEEKESLPFPTITVCFSDNFVDSKFEKFPGNVTLEQYKRIFNIIHMDKKIEDDDIALLENLNMTSYEQLVRSILLTLEDTVLYQTSLIFNHDRHCSFSKQKCTMKDLKLVWQMPGGRSCLQFNSYHPDRKPKHQTKIFSPFRIYLDERAKYNKNFFPKGMYRYRKMTLYVHEYGTPHEMYYGKSSNVVLMDRLLMDPGSLHKFYMDRHEINYMTPPYGTCGIKQLQVVKHYPYSVQSCIMDCQLHYMLETCGCIRFDMQYAVGEDVPICTISQMVRCYIPTLRVVRKRSQHCISECPLHCSRHEFNIQREEVQLPTHHNDEIDEYLGVNRSVTEKYVKNQMIGFEVRYRRMKEHKETYRQLVSLATLMATIGGSIGLGMGLSLLTLVEFLMFLMDSIKVMILRRKLGKFKSRFGSLHRGGSLHKGSNGVHKKNGEGTAI